MGGLVIDGLVEIKFNDKPLADVVAAERSEGRVT